MRIKVHKNSSGSPENPVNSPVSGNFIGSAYFAPDIQGATGTVTSVSRSADEDVMWVPPMVHVRLDSGDSIIIHKSELTKISDVKKPGSISPKAEKN